MLLLVALTVRLIYMFVMVGEVGGDKLLSLAPDTVAYSNIAHGMISDRSIAEDTLIIFGPGYGFFLAMLFFLFGTSPYPVLILQIIISSVGCLLIYVLGKELTESKSVGLLAGYLAALSFTSVSLANFILSDCLFFFLFLLGNVFFLLGMRHNRYWWYVGAGVAIGAAVLVRSIGQFWPVIMLLLVFILPRPGRDRSWFAGRLAVLKKAYLAPLIALIIMGGWMTRNYVHHGTPFLAFMTAGGPANVATLTLSEIEHKDGGAIRDEWFAEYIKTTGNAVITRADEYRILSAAARRTFFRYPLPMIKTYAGLIWENLNEENELHRAQTPRLSDFFLRQIDWLHKHSLRYRGFWLTMAAFALMLFLRRWRPLIFLGSVYIYYALLIGVTRWQGSRLFHPGQIAWSIAIAFLVITVGHLVMGLLRRRQVVQPGKKIDSTE
ncbi:MAG: glycosyltransferase family 39 protein [candidate division Zixibacteria bacterium]|nr:glycosyltransferase family 39 protein [candidate division Zixibacteria bacterium]